VKDNNCCEGNRKLKARLGIVEERMIIVLKARESSKAGGSEERREKAVWWDGREEVTGWKAQEGRDLYA
jgi:hypothetical protein